MPCTTKRPLFLTLAPALAAAVALACSDGLPVTDPTGGTRPLLANGSKGDLIARVSGKYGFSVPGGGKEDQSFHAVARGDITDPTATPVFDGNYELHVTFPDDPLYGALAGQRHRIHGAVTCFAFSAGDLTTARVGGTIEKTTLPSNLVPPGSTLIWTVRDNGEGAKDPPDETIGAFVRPPGGDLSHCSGAPGGPTLPPPVPVERGNIQVKIFVDMPSSADHAARRTLQSSPLCALMTPARRMSNPFSVA
jgi:hypothetical protein